MSWQRTVRLGVLLGRLQLKEFIRSKAAVVFGLLFPVLLLVLLASIFNETITGTGVTVAQYMTAGVLAISLATSLQQAVHERGERPGAGNAQVAARLHIGEATVKTHLLHVFTKLGVEGRTAAVTRAMELGILPPPTPR